MDQIRIWEVTTDEVAEWFDTLDAAVAYLRAEIRAGKKGGRIESRFVSAESYQQRMDIEEQQHAIR